MKTKAIYYNVVYSFISDKFIYKYHYKGLNKSIFKFIRVLVIFKVSIKLI